MTEILLTIANERPISWNTFYAGKHWKVRTQEVSRVKMAVRGAIDPDQAEIFTSPVSIQITAYFNRSPIDPDNIAAKLYIDALKGYYIDDDTGLHIMDVTTKSEIDKENPRVEIRIKD